MDKEKRDSCILDRFDGGDIAKVCGWCFVGRKDYATTVLFGTLKGARYKILYKWVEGALWRPPEAYRVAGMMDAKVPQCDGPCASIYVDRTRWWSKLAHTALPKDLFD